MFNTDKRYQKTLDYLYNKLPMFSRIGDVAIKKDLTNTIALCDFLKNPQQKFKIIHIAGTNGKGSVSHILASILQEAGYKTGLYTSPHLKDFRERIKVNGKPCSKNYVIKFTNKIAEQIEHLQPSFFEITVAMAFEYFAKKNVDIAIIETGLGGRLDSTNVVTPILSVITNVSYDHQHLLGNTLQEIATEKAGIIKKNIPVLIGRNNEPTDAVFIEKATQENVPIYFVNDIVKNAKIISPNKYLIVDAEVNNEPVNICCDLNALYQIENIKTVLAAIFMLQKNEWFVISEKAMQLGFSNVVKNTQLQGRWQTIETHPKIIIDVGHNEDGIKQIVQQLQQERYKQLYIIFGVVKDKDVNTILRLLPKDAIYYFTEPNIPRKLSYKDLFELAENQGLTGQAIPYPKDALGIAKSKANENDLILICGSFFVVTEFYN